ncbi:MAG TPA: phage tail protein [Solirubrobacteraceae bacterium]|nr:phage tail protein [Solirubrobacteraceae bacterium]
MPRFAVNTDRFDPYLNFKFKVMFDGQYVAGLSRCSALRRTTQVTTWHEGGDQAGPRRIPGKTSYEPITLEAGVTFDRTFESWANAVNSYEGEAAMSLRNFRKDITIDVFNLQGTLILRYNVFRCWVSEYQALPELAADANAVMITSLKLENEGWRRDAAVREEPER